MEEPNDEPTGVVPDNTNSEESNTHKKQKVRINKRRRISSSDGETAVDANTQESEKNLQTQATKNNLNDRAVKISKKVVTNTHMLAFAKLRDDKELAIDDVGLPSQFTRSKVNISSSDGETAVDANTQESEKNLQTQAAKNNLNDRAVKISKKVVTNTHMLAFAKLRDDKELAIDDVGLPSQFTRSKVKELMKVSPQTGPWTPQLTPIKHIPVKTRPEVKALIAQDLPDDEDDDEYKPTHDDVPSDDDQTLESGSDLESLPRTPATPKDPATSSPSVVKDGPFKVPQNISATKRKLNMDEEEATIARRTRSKLSLSSTSIEHIESTFVPPDDIPMPAVDDLWNEFLNECLNPVSTSKNEDDDEADPEYNVATDADAVDDDEENLSKSIIKISKKELTDLVTELFAIMPDGSNGEVSENLINSVMTDTSQNQISHWEGKQEPHSDEEAQNNVTVCNGVQPSNSTRFSIGKTEPEDVPVNSDVLQQHKENLPTNDVNATNDANVNNDVNVVKTDVISDEEVVIIEIKEELPETQSYYSGNPCVAILSTEPVPEAPKTAPPLVQHVMQDKSPQSSLVLIEINKALNIRPEQILIYEQQLRQHIQMSAFNYLQLCVHPVHWKLASDYKDYVTSLIDISNANPKSVVNVCNLKPAHELMASWGKAMSEKTPENETMVEFLQNQAEKIQHRAMNNNTPAGEFPEQLLRVVCNSGVFLYPHLLPPVPYRPDHVKRFTYSSSEDELIALGLDQFWRYVENNMSLLRVRCTRTGSVGRVGLTAAIKQLTQHMLPWIPARHILLHVNHVRKHGHSRNPIKMFFNSNKVEPVKHKLLPFNPKMTLYEHPESEIPRSWLKYLAKTSNRFKKQFTRSDNLIQPTTGVPVELGKDVEVPTKNPQSIDYNQPVAITELPRPNSVNNDPNANKDVFVATNLFSVLQTDTACTLVPIVVQSTNVVNTQTGPITTPAEVKSNTIPVKELETQNKGTNQADVSVNPKIDANEVTINIQVKVLETQDKDKIDVVVLEEPIGKSKINATNGNDDHCECCILLRKICKETKLITDYFKPKKPVRRECLCRDRKFPNISNRLKLFLNMYKSQNMVALNELENMVKNAENTQNNDADDFEYAVLFQIKFLSRLGLTINRARKKRLYALFNTFNDEDCPIALARTVHKYAVNELLVVYDEFLGFLTAEQAESVGVFDHYLVSYMRPLVKRIDRDITDINRRRAVLTRLQQFLKVPRGVTSCEMCQSVLLELKGYPQLAEYVFSLFPHKVCRKQDVTLQRIVVDDKEPSTVPTNTPEATICSLPSPRIERENSESGPVITETCSVPESDPKILENISNEQIPSTESNEPDASANEDSRESPENPMVIVEEIKTELPDWTREEDKILLEIIKQYLDSDESKNKSIYNILQNDEVYQLISERMTEKSMDDIVQRVMYLLEVLVVGNS